MTRETKLGLVVAGSFLALVGGVLAVKLTQGDLTPSGPDAEVAQADDEANPDSGRKPGDAATDKPQDNPVPDAAKEDASRKSMPLAPPAAPANESKPAHVGTAVAAAEPNGLKPAPRAEQVQG